MQHEELISVLKEPALEVMKELKVPASVLIGLSALILDNEDFASIRTKLIEGNNPFAILADNNSNNKKKVKKIFNDRNKQLYRTYDSMEEAVANFVTRNPNIFDEMKDIYQYHYAISQTSGLDSDQKNALIAFIEEYQIYDLDKALADQFFGKNETLIEVPPEIYKDAAEESIDEITTAINMKVKPKVAPVDVIELHTSKTKFLKKKSEKNRLYDAGEKIHLDNSNLYKTVYDRYPIRAISGDYYIYSGGCLDQRYAIVKKKEYALGGELCNPDYIMGYVDFDQIKIIEE